MRSLTLRSFYILNTATLALCFCTVMLSPSQTHAECAAPPIPDKPIPCACSPLENGFSAPTVGTVESFETRDGETWVTVRAEEGGRFQGQTAQNALLEGRLVSEYPCGKDAPAIALGQRVAGFYGPFECAERDACLRECGGEAYCKQTCEKLQYACTRTEEDATWLLYPYTTPKSEGFADQETIYIGSQDGVDYTLTYASARDFTRVFGGLQTCAWSFPPFVNVTHTPCDDTPETVFCATTPAQGPLQTPWTLFPLLTGWMLCVSMRHILRDK